MSCRHKTTVLRIPASALGFKYLGQWQEFVREHDDELQWEEGCFCEAACDAFPGGMYRGSVGASDPDRKLDQRDPEHPEIVPGPFLDLYLEDIYPLRPEEDSYGANDKVSRLDEHDKKKYLPEYQKLFPHFTLKDMEAVRRCSFEWYDGSDARYLYSEYEEE